MSLYKFHVAPDPLFVDPITGKVGKMTIWSKEPPKPFPATAVFCSWADAFNFINEDMWQTPPSWAEIIVDTSDMKFTV